jgi:hypothetical protein
MIGRGRNPSPGCKSGGRHDRPRLARYSLNHSAEEPLLRWKIAPLDDRADVLADAPAGQEQWERRFRGATNGGKPSGSKTFVERLERLTGASLALRRLGRPKKEAGKAKGAAVCCQN